MSEPGLTTNWEYISTVLYMYNTQLISYIQQKAGQTSIFAADMFMWQKEMVHTVYFMGF